MFGQSLLDCGIIHHVFDKLHSFEVPCLLSFAVVRKDCAMEIFIPGSFPFLPQNDDNTPYRFRVDDGTFLDPRLTQDVREWGLRLYLRLYGVETNNVVDYAC